jgi:hypothetical protein
MLLQMALFEQLTISSKFHLYNIKAQKEAGQHLTSDENQAKEVERNKLMNSINRVISGKIS